MLFKKASDRSLDLILHFYLKILFELEIIYKHDKHQTTDRANSECRFIY